jgi:hypothetical protein
MTHRRRDCPWRVTVDSLSADIRFAFSSPRTAHFGAATSQGCGTPGSRAGVEYRRFLAAVPSPEDRPAIQSP